MTEIARITDQLERAYKGSAWHGPSLMEALEGVSYTQAVNRPLEHAHSIWEIVLHLAATNETVTKRLNGIPAVLSPEQDWPSAGSADAHGWKSALDRLNQSHEELIKALQKISGDRLDDPVIEDFSPAYITVHGNIQHLIYHAGQIMLLKKQ